MKNKIILLLLLIILSSFAYAQEECEGYSYEGYCYSNYKYLFMDNPFFAAENYPDEYMNYIDSNPDAVSENPEAYEKVIVQDAEYINQNKEAFIAYAKTEFIEFTSIEGEFSDYDSSTGKFQTKGDPGTSFEFDHIANLKGNDCSNFRINEHGELVFDQPYVWDIDIELVTQEVSLDGNLEDVDGEIYLTDGKFSFEDEEIEISGFNQARLLLGCGFQNKECGIIEIEAVDSPVDLPEGTLLSGKAYLRDPSGLDLELEENSKYRNNKGALFEVTKFTRVTQNRKACEGYEYPSSISCIYDDEFLLIRAVDRNQIKIEADDGSYENIVVKEIKDGVDKDYKISISYEQQMYNVDRFGNVYDLDGNLLESTPEGKKLAQEIYSSSQHESAVNSFVDYGSTVELTLNKEDGATKVVFSNIEPQSQGNLNGLQTNVAHVFESEDDKFPWIVYNGEPSSAAKGNIESGFANEIIKFAKNKGTEEIKLLFETTDFNLAETKRIIAGLEGDSELQKFIVGEYIGYRVTNTPLSYEEAIIEGLAVSTDFPQIQREIIDELGGIDPTNVGEALFLIEDSELEREIIEGLDVINDPGKALASIETQELQRMIIEKSKTLELEGEYCYIVPVDQCFDYVNNYITALTKLDPELQELAVSNLDFESGVFADRIFKSRSRTLAIRLSKDNPEFMKTLLEHMEEDEDLGLNPQVLSQVYFDEHFQDQTTDLDFANQYSIALTAQRYFKRAGVEATPENIQEVTDLILKQRENFAEHIILGEDTYFIALTHEQRIFDNDRMIKFAEDAGVDDVAPSDLKGSEAKERFLDNVIDSGIKGKTTIHFNGHGGPNHIWLAHGEAGEEVSDEMSRPEAISYVELGDALIERGNLEEVDLMIDSCFSNDFKNNLYAYLHENDVTEMPIVITETNRGSVGYTETFMPALENSHESGTPLTGADIYEVESETFARQDLSVTMPLTSEIAKEYSDPQTPGVIDMGSTFDEGYLTDPEITIEEEAEIELPAELPPTVIEIAANEEEMEERLGIAVV